MKGIKGLGATWGGPNKWHKAYHRDACVVLDAANICLINVSRHPFLPGLSEVENNSIVVQEIVEELFRKFAGDTCLLFGCCPNFYPRATECIALSKQALGCFGCCRIWLGLLYTHQGIVDVSGYCHPPLWANTGFLPNFPPSVTCSEERTVESKGNSQFLRMVQTWFRATFTPGQTYYPFNP